jgi:hypothetical protein
MSLNDKRSSHAKLISPSEEVGNIERQADELRRNFAWEKIQKTLPYKINQWQKESIQKIQHATAKLHDDVQQRIDEFRSSYENLITKLSNSNNNKKSDMKQLKTLLETSQRESQKLSTIETEIENLPLPLIKFESENSIGKKDLHSTKIEPGPSIPPTAIAMPLGDTSACFGINEATASKIQELFQYLQSLLPMDKDGSMKGDCNRETTQMEQFLKQNFDFKNTSKDIVHGVRAFKLRKPLESMDPSRGGIFTLPLPKVNRVN